MPEGVSRERRMIIESYGGEVIFSPATRESEAHLQRRPRGGAARRFFAASIFQPR